MGVAGLEGIERILFLTDQWLTAPALQSAAFLKNWPRHGRAMRREITCVEKTMRGLRRARDPLLPSFIAK
jgi:hypothetical protein